MLIYMTLQAMFTSMSYKCVSSAIARSPSRPS
jgi:hypothetical protein